MLTSFDRVTRSGTPELDPVRPLRYRQVRFRRRNAKALVPCGGFFASGKFDQHKRDMPYATLAHALQGLIRGLLAKSDADLAPWRNALHEALRQSRSTDGDLVPELRLVIGDQPPVPECLPQDAQRRFQLVVRRFIGIFAEPRPSARAFLRRPAVARRGHTGSDTVFLLNRSDLQICFSSPPIDARMSDVNIRWHNGSSKFAPPGNGCQEIDLAPLTRAAVEEFTGCITSSRHTPCPWRS